MVGFTPGLLPESSLFQDPIAQSGFAAQSLCGLSRPSVTSNGAVLQAPDPLPDREVGLRLQHAAERRVARRLQLQVRFSPSVQL